MDREQICLQRPITIRPTEDYHVLFFSSKQAKLMRDHELEIAIGVVAAGSRTKTKEDIITDNRLPPGLTSNVEYDHLGLGLSKALA